MRYDRRSDEEGEGTRPFAEGGDRLEQRLPDWPRIWAACRRRIFSWPVPPRWDTRDWREELEAEGSVAACHAFHKFDPARGTRLGSFVFYQVLAAALARYRREWRYGLRFHSSLEVEEAFSLSGEEVADDDDRDRLRATMGRMVDDDRRIIHHLFWDGWSESRVALSLGISQQAVNKKKRRILHQLRRQFAPMR